MKYISFHVYENLRDYKTLMLYNEDWWVFWRSEDRCLELICSISVFYLISHEKTRFSILGNDDDMFKLAVLNWYQKKYVKNL